MNLIQLYTCEQGRHPGPKQGEEPMMVGKYSHHPMAAASLESIHSSWVPRVVNAGTLATKIAMGPFCET